jgi:Protein of unknown function (DUF2384)
LPDRLVSPQPDIPVDRGSAALMSDLQSVESIIDDLRDLQSGGLSPMRLANILVMTQAELADLIGVKQAELDNESDALVIQCKLEPLAKILARACVMGGGMDKAVSWFRDTPLPPFGGKRAIDVVAAGRSTKVLEWLDALEDGAFG